MSPPCGAAGPANVLLPTELVGLDDSFDPTESETRATNETHRPFSSVDSVGDGTDI